MSLRKILAMLVAILAIASCTSGGGEKKKSKDDADDGFANKDSVTVIKDYHEGGKNVWHVKEVLNLNYPKTGKEAKWVLHGTVYEYYSHPANTLAFTTEYKNGKKDGTSIKYYKSGKPYMEWQYVNGKKEGIVKKYNEASGYVISEVPYKHDMLGTGSKEFNQDGKELTMPELKVWVKDTRRQNGTYAVYAKVVDKRGNNMPAEFFSGLLIDGQYSHPNLQEIKVGSDRVASVKFFESTGFPPFVNIVAKTSTSKRTPVLLTEMVQIN